MPHHRRRDPCRRTTGRGGIVLGLLIGLLALTGADALRPSWAQSAVVERSISTPAKPIHRFPRPRFRPQRSRRADAGAPSSRFPRPRKRPARPALPHGSSAPSIASSSSYDAAADASPLKPLRQSLVRLCGGASRVPVEVLHLGDSHTAGDVFTGYLRDRFQAEYGDGGRGMLPAGVPFKYYRPRQLKVSRDNSWKHHNSIRRKSAGPFGVTGFRAVGERSNQRVVMKSSSPDPFQLFKLEVRTRGDGGALNIKLGDSPVARVSTRQSRRSRRTTAGIAHWMEPLRARDGSKLPFMEHTFYLPQGVRSVEVWPAGDGPVELMSWSVRDGRPGVLYHSQGVVGATAEIVRRWDPTLVKAELDRLRPDLVLLAYGTNEGFNDGLDLARYRRVVRAELKSLKDAAPYAAFAVAGPPGAARMPRHCPKSARKTASCRPLDASERRNYRKLIRAKSPSLCRWHAPPNLSPVRDALASLAREEGYFFWDWSAVMGEECGIDGWVRRSPRLAYTDRVHMTNKGYRRSADSLYKALRGDARCDAPSILSAN